MFDSPPHLTERLVAWLLRHRAILFGIAIISAVVSIPAALSLEFDQRIESLYAVDDPQLGDYRRSKEMFGGDELALVAWEQPGLFDDMGALDPGAADQITEFAARLSAIPGINSESTLHLADALAVPYRQERGRELMEGLLVDAAGRTTGIVLRFEPEERAPVTRGETIRLIREAAAEHGERSGHETFVVGEPVQIHDMFRYVEEDGNTFFLWTVLLLAIVVFTYFRSLRWTLLPLAVVASSIVWTRALLAVSGLQLSMVSSMLNSIVTIVGVSTVTHLTVRFREHRHELGPRESLERTLVQLLPSVFWTCATTIVGFAALLTSEIAPVRSFGAMMGLGTAFVFVAICTLLPGGALIGRPGAERPEAHPDGPLGETLSRVAESVERWPGRLLFAGLGLSAVCFVGLFRLELETDFSENFHAESDIIRSLDFYEARLGGAGTWEVNFPAPRPLDEAYLVRVRQLAERIRAIESNGRITKVVALTDGLDLVPATIPNPVQLPFVPKEITMPLDQRLGVLRGLQPEFVPGLYNPAAGRMRIVIRAHEREAAEEKRELIEEAATIAGQAFPEAVAPDVRPRATGLYVLLVFLIESLMRDQIVSFACATVGILLVMSIAFRSPRIGLVSLVPNLFPICVVLGTMGWLGLRINIATAMISCVSMGLTTDATVHFIASFQRARRRGTDVHAAITQTIRETGRAIVFATVALVVGFSVLTLSHFVPLVYFGLLVDAAMIGGLVGDLILLPILLAWTDRAPPSTEGRPTSGQRNEIAEW